LEDFQAKADDHHNRLWEDLKMKVSQKLFFWMMGIAVVILLTTFGAIYEQGSKTLEKVQAHQIDMVKIQSALQSHTQSTEILKGMMNEIKEENGRR